MTLIIGDLHINSAKISSCILIDKFINWLNNLKENNKNNNLILLGDVLDNPVNSGATISYLIKLLNSFKFNKVYILIGNHDIFKNQDESEYKNKSALDWINKIDDYKNVEIINSAKQITIDNTNYLLLPYINKYTELNNKDYNFESIDYILGHIDLGDYCLYNIDTILKKSKNIKSLILGHIHCPIRFNYLGKDINFIGSFYPTRQGEEIANDFILNQHKGTEKTLRSYALIDDNTKSMNLINSPFSVDYNSIDDIDLNNFFEKDLIINNTNQFNLIIYNINIFNKSFNYNLFSDLTLKNNFIRKDLNSYYNNEKSILLVLKKDNDNYNFTTEINNLVNNKNLILENKSLLDYFIDFEETMEINKDVSNKIKILLNTIN